MGFLDKLKKKHNVYYARKIPDSTVISVMISDNAADSYLTHLHGPHMEEVRSQSNSFKKRKFNLTSATVGNYRSVIREKTIKYAIWAGGYSPYGDYRRNQTATYNATYKEPEWEYILNNFNEMLNIDPTVDAQWYVKGLFDVFWLPYVNDALDEGQTLQPNTIAWFWKAAPYLSYEQEKLGLSRILKQEYENPSNNDYFDQYYNGISGFSLPDFSNAIEAEIQRLIRESNPLYAEDWQSNTNVEDDVNSGYIVLPTVKVTSGEFSFRWDEDLGGDGETYVIDKTIYNKRIDDRIDDRITMATQFNFASEGVRAALIESAVYTAPMSLLEHPSGLVGIKLLSNVEPTRGAAWYEFGTRRPYKPIDLVISNYINFVIDVESARREARQSEPLPSSLTDIMQQRVAPTAKFILASHLYYYESAVRQSIMRALSEEGAIPPVEGSAEASRIIEEAEQEAAAQLVDLSTENPFREKLSEETIRQRTKLYKQCALLLNLDKLSIDYAAKAASELGTVDIHKTEYYNGRLYLLESGGDPSFNQSKIINKLNTPKAEQIAAFKNMTPDIYAALQPKIRLFKVYFDPKDKKSVTHEIPFAASYSKDRINNLFQASTSIDRGEGAGIKEFSFTFDGETPATSTKYVRATLTLFFQSFQDFVKERKVIDNGKEYTFRYLDLFVNTKFCPRSGDSSFSPLYYDPSFYRLRADVGWATREGDAQFASILKKRGHSIEDFQTALGLTNKTFYLNLIDHNIDIQNDGTITVKAEYFAYIEGMLDSNRMNALLGQNERQAQSDAVKQFEELVESNSCNADERRQLKNAINAFANSGAQNTRQRLVRELLINGRVYTVGVKDADLVNFRTTDFFTSTPEIQGASDAPALQPDAEKLGQDRDQSWNYISSNFINDPDYQKNQKIYFFYFGDLVYYLLECLYDKEGNPLPEVENIKVLLTSFVITDPFKGEQLVNIGEIPVDLETFTSWYDDHIIKKEITNISVIEFIKKFLFYLIAEVFGETCINQDSIKKLMFQTSNILAFEEGGTSLFTTFRQQGENRPLLISDVDLLYDDDVLPLATAVPDSMSTNTSNLMNYLVIFPYYADSFHSGRGNRTVDENNGVYHFDIGAKNGLVKTVSFSKTDIEGLRESRMFNQGNNSLLQLSSVYKCSLTMIGNTLLYPGMEFWLNPFGIGGTEFGFPQNGQGTPDKPNLANIMGIGGYQQVLKTTSTISPGKFETTIDAHYVYSGEQGGSTNYREKILSTCDNITDVDAPDEAEQNENNCNTAIRRAEFVASALATRGAIPNIDDVPVSTRPEGVDSEDTNLSKPEESIYNDRPVEASLNFGDTAAERAPPISRPDLGG